MDHVSDRSLDRSSLFSSDIHEAIINTLCFFDVLEYPLTEEELRERLPLGRDVDIDEVRVAIARLINDGRVVRDGTFITLPSSKYYCQQRRDGEIEHDELMRRARKWAWIFRWVPFVEEVYLCNSLALAQADKESDIDVFVVMKNGRMFLGRFFLLLIFHILGLRRHGKCVTGRFCFSFLVDDSVKDFSWFLLNEHDVYFAYWTATLLPLFCAKSLNDKDAQMISSMQSGWLTRIFGLTMPKKSFSTFGRSLKRRILDWIFSGRIGDFLEGACEKWQIKRAQQKWSRLGFPRGVVIEKHVLKFHDQDRREVISRAFSERVRAQ